MGPTFSIPHGNSLLFGDYLLWLAVSAAGVGGVAGPLAEVPSGGQCRREGMVPLNIRLHGSLSSVCLGRCEGHQTCGRHGNVYVFIKCTYHGIHT